MSPASVSPASIVIPASSITPASMSGPPQPSSVMPSQSSSLPLQVSSGGAPHSPQSFSSAPAVHGPHVVSPPMANPSAGDICMAASVMGPQLPSSDSGMPGLFMFHKRWNDATESSRRSTPGQS